MLREWATAHTLETPGPPSSCERSSGPLAWLLAAPLSDTNVELGRPVPWHPTSCGHGRHGVLNSSRHWHCLEKSGCIITRQMLAPERGKGARGRGGEGRGREGRSAGIIHSPMCHLHSRRSREGHEPTAKDLALHVACSHLTADSQCARTAR